jgi:UDP-glucuronate decarboxylase
MKGEPSVSHKRILVTGGAGFIGTHLCQRLVEQGHDVVCLDNLYTGSKENIRDLLKWPNFQFIRQDVCQPMDFYVDQIYNLACPASPVHYQDDPIGTWKSSVFGAYNVLELAVRCRATVLQASTSEVYGEPLQHPQTESYWGNVNPVGVRGCYDNGKRAAETIFMDYHREHHTNIRIARIFNTYGPKMHPYDGRVVSNFIRQALLGQDITIYGDGTQTRSFCYVSDLVDGLVWLMNQGPFTPVNLGNPTEFTINQLANNVIEMTKTKSKIVYEPLPQDDPTQRRPDISKAKEWLQWEPKVVLRQGLSYTIDYFRQLDLEKFHP